MKMWLLLLASLVICEAHDATAEPLIEKNVEYYDVYGTDTAFIVDEMNAKGPEEVNSGDRFWAQTRWRVKWRISYNEQNTSCEISDINTVFIFD